MIILGIIIALWTTSCLVGLYVVCLSLQGKINKVN